MPCIMPHEVGELLTTASVALITGVVPATVRLWERTGKVTPAYRTPSGVCLYLREDAERLRAARAKVTRPTRG
jgi:DNA-binding transcriptional MerR regulator